MDKKEIIKLLRYESNCLKDIERNTNEEAEEKIEANDIKKRFYINAILVYLFAGISIKLLYDEQYTLALIESLIVINSFGRLSDSYIEYKNFIMKENHKDLNSYDNSTKINNIEMAIDFLRDLTTEEESKYLKLNI